MIHIEPAREEDLDFVYTCMNELTGETFDPGVFGDMFRQFLQSENAFPLIITNNNEKIGYMGMLTHIQLHHCGKVAEIHELFVLPAFRSSGVGRVAVEFARTFAREKGCVMIELSSNIKRTEAHRFYQANGFKHTHTRFTCEL